MQLLLCAYAVANTQFGTKRPINRKEFTTQLPSCIKLILEIFCRAPIPHYALKSSSMIVLSNKFRILTYLLGLVYLKINTSKKKLYILKTVCYGFHCLRS